QVRPALNAAAVHQFQKCGERVTVGILPVPAGERTHPFVAQRQGRIEHRARLLHPGVAECVHHGRPHASEPRPPAAGAETDGPRGANIAMNSTTERSAEDHPDELDRLLTGYFRSEVPSAWPSLPTPGTTQPAAPMRNRRLSQSRLMLAASIAALLLGSWLVTGKRLGPVHPAVSLPEGAAKVPLDLRPDSGRPIR